MRVLQYGIAQVFVSFQVRNLSHYFDGGIFGSPDDKQHILKREIQNGNIKQPAIFFGDSRYDFVSSKHFNIDFVFISQWTDFQGWQDFVKNENIPTVDSLLALL